MRRIDSIIIHCTASPDYMDIGVKEIDEWHRDKGWSQIGYHYVVRRNGEIERGRPIEIQGAHAKGANQTSIGIVWVGTNSPDEIQYKKMVGLVNLLRGKYNIPIDNVLGHREAVQTSKTCPNIDMIKFRAELAFIQDPVEVR